MHLADGVLSMPAVTVTSVVAGGLLIYSLKGIKEEEIPKISLLTAAFFVLALISIPVGPSSIHPMLAGLLGIFLGRRSIIAVFIGLLLQALLFQHGGITTLGANTLLIGVPALFCAAMYRGLQTKLSRRFLLSGIIGTIGVIGTVLLLIVTLLFSDARYGEGFFSVIHLLIVGHIPLMIIEFFLTGFAVAFILRVRPNILQQV